jgi:hypothetical protein
MYEIPESATIQEVKKHNLSPFLLCFHGRGGHMARLGTVCFNVCVSLYTLYYVMNVEVSSDVLSSLV